VPAAAAAVFGTITAAVPAITAVRAVTDIGSLARRIQ
jgi:hypothetical protein